MRRGCIFCRACSGRGRGSNCCRLYTPSLLLNPVPQELKNELLPPPTHSFTRRDSNGDPRVSLLDLDFSKEFPFEFAVQSYGCTKLNVMYTNDTDSVKLCLASVLWLHQVLEHSPVSSVAPTAPSLRWREGRTRRFGHLVQQACRHPEAIQDHRQWAGEGLRG